jgi:hypothetical protein
MKIKNSQKFLFQKMTEQDYRTSILQLMFILEEHSEEFKTPEQLVALIHEYTELMATVYSIDTDEIDDGVNIIIEPDDVETDDEEEEE